MPMNKEILQKKNRGNNEVKKNMWWSKSPLVNK